jgi:GMP synthase-like glutamine amidotransferase
MNILVVDNNRDIDQGISIHELVKVLESTGKCKVTRVKSMESFIRLGNIHKTDPWDGIILGGSNMSHSKRDKMLFDCIRTMIAARSHFPRAPTLGICFGMQTLAEAFGGRVKRLKSARGAPPTDLNRPVLDGWKQVTLDTQSCPIFQGLATPTLMKHYNSDVVKDIPPGFRSVGQSAEYDVVAIEAKDHLVWGVQFHPELSGKDGMKIIDNFLKVCGTVNNIKNQEHH